MPTLFLCGDVMTGRGVDVLHETGQRQFRRSATAIDGLSRFEDDDLSAGFRDRDSRRQPFGLDPITTASRCPCLHLDVERRENA